MCLTKHTFKHDTPIQSVCCDVLMCNVSGEVRQPHTGADNNQDGETRRSSRVEVEGGGGRGAVPLEIKIQRNELWVVCVSLRPSGADIQHLLCGISFVLIRSHCTAGQPELRAGVGAGVAAGPHRVALLPPLRRGPGRLLPGRDVRRAGGVSAPHQDLQPPPLPGGEPRRRSK